MKWRGRRGSSNIEDRRGAGGRGGLGRMRMPRGRGARRAGGIGGLGAVAIILVGMFLGVDTSYLLGGGGVSGFQLPNQNASQPNAIDDDMEQFVSVVLADTEEVWSAIFAKELNRRYQPPKLVLFSGATRSACGSAS